MNNSIDINNKVDLDLAKVYSIKLRIMKLNIKSNIFTDTTYKNFINEIISRGFKRIVLIVDKKVSKFRIYQR